MADVPSTAVGEWRTVLAAVEKGLKDETAQKKVRVVVRQSAVEQMDSTDIGRYENWQESFRIHRDASAARA